jgi:hypothetical protein
VNNVFYSDICLILALKYSIHWRIVESPSRYMSFPARQSFISIGAKLQMRFHVCFQTWPLGVVHGILGLHFSSIETISSVKRISKIGSSKTSNYSSVFMKSLLCFLKCSLTSSVLSGGSRKGMLMYPYNRTSIVQ